MTRKHLILILVCYGVAGLLLASNFTGLYGLVWQKLDIQVFRSLNNTIGIKEWLTTLWAWTNSKTFDRGVFVAMACLCGYIVLSSDKGSRISAIAKILSITLLIAIGLLISKRLLGDLDHPSPGAALAPIQDLNDFISGYTVKTASENSFPGDHAMTSLLFAGGIILLFNRPYVAAVSVLLVLLVSLPRLAGGGHWFTDVLVGGGAASLLLLPLLIVTPMASKLERLFQWGYGRLPSALKGKAPR